MKPKKTVKKAVKTAAKKTVKRSVKSQAQGTAEAPIQGIWSGTISFSLVAIPVRLVKAVEPGRVAFRMLHGKDYSPLKRKMYCPDEEKIVESDDIIRGYEISPGKHVIITDEELESVSPDLSRTIEIIEFIDAGDVDPLYYDHPYFLVPLKGGEKPYRLLAEALKRTKKAGIAKFVLGEREYLVEVTSRDKTLVLTTLHYSDEILPEMSPAKVTPSDAEKESIKKFIRSKMTGFAPAKYADPRREKILEILKARAKEKAQVESPESDEDKSEGIENLMAALQESMRRAKKG